ncbi:Rieske 2Fe-2S domain-containing protein [Scytonema sp. PCC 10023]|uniref:Rieske-type oxygenase n=1 Tax=Scytonema sp. PCC 10023 TaxID=1680591 RepID=A0A2D1CM50_9CYAN|nr:MstG [Scytonema sp. PCC 10023]
MSLKLEQVKESKLTQSKSKVDKTLMDLAASWYIAMECKDLGKKPKAIELFGQPLVAWRDQNGHPVIMQRYCSHMGASLGIGKVVDGCIQCPFHHWRYDNSGQCVSIPEVENIPSTARQVNYASVERYGYIWAWYGSETPLFPLPEFFASGNEKHNYIPVSRFTLNTKTTVPRLLENAYDYAHFVPVHDLKVIKEPVKSTLLSKLHPEQQNELLIPNEAWFGALIEVQLKGYVGIVSAILHALGLKFEKMTLLVNSWTSGHMIKTLFQGDEKLKVMVATTPVDEVNTMVRIWLMVKKPGKFWLSIPYCMLFSLQPKASALEDLPVWNTMKPNGGGSYVKHDHLILKFREFYQKWVDKAE